MHRYVQRTIIEDCIIMIQRVKYQPNLTDIDKDDILRTVSLKLGGVERAMTAEIDDMVEDWMVD